MASSNGEYSTVIGPDARFKGTLEFEKNAQLLGRFEGQIVTQGEFVVAEGAKLDGEVDAASIRLDGEVHGNLRASGKIHLSASAKLEGDLHTARLEVVDGASFIGHCSVAADGEHAGQRKGKSAAPELAGRPKSAASAAQPSPTDAPVQGKGSQPEPELSRK
jgi:cytoskeletal protein CcmA (bactofilin family)